MASKRSPKFMLGFLLAIVALVFLVVAFATPYWYQSFPDAFSEFKNLGLWEVCFEEFQHPKDKDADIFTGCWWVYREDEPFRKLREWICLPWFIAVQIMVTATLLCQIAGIIFLILYFLSIRDNAQLVTFSLTASTGLMFFSGFLLLLANFVFGIKSEDRTWMPRPDQNLLSWSFGMSCISMFISACAGGILYLVRKDELNYYAQKSQNPPNYPMHGLHLPPQMPIQQRM